MCYSEHGAGGLWTHPSAAREAGTGLGSGSRWPWSISGPSHSPASAPWEGGPKGTPATLPSTLGPAPACLPTLGPCPIQPQNMDKPPHPELKGKGRWEEGLSAELSPAPLPSPQAALALVSRPHRLPHCLSCRGPRDPDCQTQRTPIFSGRSSRAKSWG